MHPFFLRLIQLSLFQPNHDLANKYDAEPAKSGDVCLKNYKKQAATKKMPHLTESITYIIYPDTSNPLPLAVTGKRNKEKS